MVLPTLHAPHGCTIKVANYIFLHPYLHEWEADFSEGEPDPKSPICGICGRSDDKWHFKKAAV